MSWRSPSQAMISRAPTTKAVTTTASCAGQVHPADRATPTTSRSSAATAVMTTARLRPSRRITSTATPKAKVAAAAASAAQ